MKIEKLLDTLSLEQKIFQMFILGFSGVSLGKDNLNIQKAVRLGLGGIILFSENIRSYSQAAKLTQNLQKIAKIPLFISIDQEGGKVERTGNVKNKIKYLSPGELAAGENPEAARIQAEIMSKELKFMGINMNFVPVIDVNTNPDNPIIGIRSFGNNPDTVIKFAKPVYETFIKNKIIPVVKHFPGHGPTGEDSHLTMPVVELDMEELENIHIKPFKQAIDDGVNAIMANHAHYKAFNKEGLPASLSHAILNEYLREKLKFKGIVISDDMVMGGIKNYFTGYEACLKGIQAGIDVFIYRDSSEEIFELAKKLCDAVKKGELAEDKINESVKRILICKEKFMSISNGRF
ncbi:MAG TPA: glycoside hydrolase family 3 protein [Candidatus Gastranaerophilales bacterium]|nr:glycoside hydrolase family 3 protein [Candidatus Gastranaerophilales bacterium]